MRVMVVVPTHDNCKALFAYDLAQMMGFTSAALLEPQGPLKGINLSFLTGTYIHRARQRLVEAALEQDADYILWLDSDMRFPPDTLVRLLNRDKDLVGANYSKRGFPPEFVAVKSIQNDEQCVTGPDSEGVESVEALGFGVVLMRVSALLDLHNPRGPEGPWFFFKWDEEKGSAFGEDVYFCELFRQAGHEIFVDHDLSKLCGHIGDFEFRVEHAWENVDGAD